MKHLTLICTIWLVAYCPSWAGDQRGRFLEFSDDQDTVTFDLDTVQVIQPGRFTVIETTIDNPDVMRFRLKVLSTLRSYCSRPVGQYPAPTDLLMLGPPERPVKSIVVRNMETWSPPTKQILWYYPYKRFESMYAGEFECKQDNRAEEESFSEARSVITNGIRTKRLYDCKRGLWGETYKEDDDPSKAMVGSVPTGTLAFKYYQSVCQAVTHEAPYVPKE